MTFCHRTAEGDPSAFGDDKNKCKSKDKISRCALRASLRPFDDAQGRAVGLWPFFFRRAKALRLIQGRDSGKSNCKNKANTGILSFAQNDSSWGCGGTTAVRSDGKNDSFGNDDRMTAFQRRDYKSK
jgi:hypothetical protein